MSRSDAVRRAKEEKEGYVVWLQLVPNNVSGQIGIYDDPYDVYLQYSVFAPTTGKQVTSGTTDPKSYRNQRARIPGTTSDGDYYLNQAARGAAERILAHFHLAIPNTRTVLSFLVDSVDHGAIFLVHYATFHFQGWR
jgi:hypothetical protein